MPEDPEYAPPISITLARVIASVLVLIWIGSAWKIGGLPLAIRATTFFLIPLSFIWIPEWMARIAGVASRKSLEADIPMLPGILKGVGWLVIVGVPAVWVIFAISL